MCLLVSQVAPLISKDGYSTMFLHLVFLVRMLVSLSRQPTILAKWQAIKDRQVGPLMSLHSFYYHRQSLSARGQGIYYRQLVS